MDVLAYNSKVYYVITDGGGYGEQVYRLPITGNKTVLDALSQINGLPPVASKKHMLGSPALLCPYYAGKEVPHKPEARAKDDPSLALQACEEFACRGNNEGRQQILPVDWVGITQSGVPTTNYQILPGDRIYVKADCWITFDARVAKIIAPFERMFGITLLGSETVNSIRGINGGVP